MVFGKTKVPLAEAERVPAEPLKLLASSVMLPGPAEIVPLLTSDKVGLTASV